MAFHDDRLPDDVERGAEGGPRFKTTVLALASGFERRNQDWVRERHEWDISYGIQNQAGYTQVLNHFYNRRGRFHSFPFKDWTDFNIGDLVNPTTTNQTIGVGDAVQTSFQIVKDYVSGAFTFTRTITKPVLATTVVLLDNVIQGSGFTVNRLTGFVDFSVAPALNVVVGVATEYDIPMRYDVDLGALSVSWVEAASIPSLPILQVRGE